MLDQVPLFSTLSDEDLDTLESYAKSKSYRKNTVIVEKGDDPHALFILATGKVRVYLADDEGKEIVLSVYDRAGSYFGELALLDESERTASVMTMEDSRFLVLSKRDFIAALKGNPQIALHLIHDLVEQVKSLTDRVGSLALDDVYGRIASFLKEQAREEDGRLITGRLTHQDIARMVGASREMITRILKELRAGGYLEIENKRIILLKKLPARW